MCGIAGLLVADDCTGRGALAPIARTMGARLAHRGPDAAGSWIDEEANVALSHQRLSIQDLSAAGAQPMISECGRYVLVYNGEIYNASVVGAELEARGARFRGHSDTEVLLAAIAAWGLERALRRSVGMFALAVWDRERRELSLARDRVGIKPLFWSCGAGRLVFASELKALLLGVAERPAVDRAGLASYLHYGYVVAPHTIYSGVQKLTPGTILRLRAGEEPRATTFWSLEETLEGITKDERITDPAEGRQLIEESLGLAVRQRLVADVPLGAFLSGGVDSSLITALMQEQADAPIHSYSIGSSNPEYDEASYARDVAGHLGTIHTELIVDEFDCLDVVSGLTDVYDEPFGDSSQVPTLVLSRLARKHVTVALSGDGGDELFAGYNRHSWYHRLSPLRHIAPRPLRRAGALLAGGLPPAALDRLGRAFTGQAAIGRRAHKLSSMIGAHDPESAHRAVLKQWAGLGLEGAEQLPAAYRSSRRLTDFSGVERMQALDLLTYLPDDILTKVDRASMAHSLEVRVPFLDHEVIRAAFRLVPEQKVSGSVTKVILRAMLSDRVPRELIERPKMGFAIPIEHWLRRDLREWAEDLIMGTDWQGDLGIIPGPIRRAWSAHQAGSASGTDALWSMLMLGAWWRKEVRSR